MTSETTRDGKAASRFISDLEPFLYGRPMTYVDIGAHHGAVLLELLNSSLRVREAHLIEPNPASFRTLKANAAGISESTRVSCHQLAISSSPGVVTMRDEGTMTHVTSAPERPTTPRAELPYFDVQAVTLDDFVRDQQLAHIHLLKVDVEGHELAVLEGAKDLLAAELVDVVYIEAGMNPDATQQVYYRDVEDALRAHGYRVHRFYEQRNEWPSDSPVLRRANLAFFSSAFSASNPYRVTRELFRIRKRHDELTTHAGELETTVRELREESSALKELLDETVTRATEEAGKRQKLEQELTAARSEKDAFVAYADELEAGYRKVLRSSSWRMTGPVRVGVRTARRLLGRPASARNRMPLRPTSGSPSGAGAVGGTAGAVDEVMRRLKTSDFAGVYRLRRELESDLASNEGFLDHAFATVALAKKSSTFAFGAQAADAALRRYEGRRGELVGAFGAKGYPRFIADAAYCYTRIGRYGDARALLDTAVDGGMAELLPARAEICWIHDPEQAAHDLDAHLARGRNNGGQNGQSANALLREQLALNVLGESPSASAERQRDQFRLVHAGKALSDGRLGDYRELVNGFFTDQGLAGPLDSSSAPFSFDGLRCDGLDQRTGGPLVSVIMTTHNSAGTLRYAVRSILDQTHRNLELIVVDDGSSDTTVELLEELSAADERIRVIRNSENMGTYAARNLGMVEAGGSYITFHDSDDWAHPQRIATHLDAMEGQPGLLVTRSNWLRVDPRGKIDFRRWHRRFAHPNPASIFIRGDVTDRIGYFDMVRFGADSEYWFRAIRACGRAAVSNLQASLGLGRHHDESLTRSGVGARDAEEYSPIRAAYQYSWLEWHARTPVERLRLDAAADDRPFWAPPDMLARPAASNEVLPSLARSYPGQCGEHDVPAFVFGVSLASKKASSDWPRTEQLLARTLRSVLSQTDGRWRAIVCGHERPDLPELDDPRVMFVVADIGPPKDAKNFRKDKMWKRRLIGSILRDLGGGYFCPLDADDLVHKKLVEHVLGDDNRRGYNIGTGYVQDLANDRLAPVPGVWSVPFDRVCGTSAVLYFDPDDLPRNGQLDPALYFNLFQSHAYWPVVAEECGRPLDPVPFAAAVYVVNHSQNLSFGLQRAGDRTANIIASIESHAMSDGQELLADSFGQRDHD